MGLVRFASKSVGYRNPDFFVHQSVNAVIGGAASQSPYFEILQLLLLLLLIFIIIIIIIIIIMIRYDDDYSRSDVYNYLNESVYVFDTHISNIHYV